MTYFTSTTDNNNLRYFILESIFFYNLKPQKMLVHKFNFLSNDNIYSLWNKAKGKFSKNSFLRLIKN